MKNKVAAWIALGLIAIVAALCLATTNEITKDVIEAQNVKAAEEARQALVPGADTFEAAALADGSAADSLYTGLADGKAVGYVAQVTVQGFGGPVEIIAGTDLEGTLTGIKVGGGAFSETAGLGAKAREPGFTDQFAGKTAPLAVGETIDAITAATITSSAVVRGVNSAIEEIGKVAGFEIASTSEGGAMGDNRYSASVRGFAGPVYVEIHVDGAGAVDEIIIGNDEFAETAGYGQRAKEPAFYEQFLGKTGSVTLGTDVDTVSGATITSKAVVEAFNLAMLYHTDPEAAANAGKKEEFVMPDVPADAMTASSSSKGFGGPVQVKITVDAAGEKLLRVEFGGDMWAETEGLGSRIKEPDFWQQFINQPIPIDPDSIDTITGATITSEAAIKAVNKAYTVLFPDSAAEEPAVQTVAPAPVDTGAAESEGRYAKASSAGFGGPVAAALVIDADNKVESVVFGDDTFAETQGLGTKVLEPEFAALFIGKALPIASGDIDVITGATVSTEAAIKAVNKAYDKIVAARQPAATEAPAPEATVAPAAQAPGNTANASKRGYDGPVFVEITVDDAGAISAVKIGNDNFNETPGLGAKALEPEFAAQFIGKVPPLALTDIDAITGATVTSEAVINAINAAYEKLAPAVEIPVVQPEPAVEVFAASNTANASKLGYEGPVYVEISVDAAGAIASIVIGNDRFSETAGLGAKALEPEFAVQFIGKVPPLALTDIDAITGATVTSEAVINAINAAYAKIAPATETPAEEILLTESTAAQKSANASKRGYDGPVYVEITVDDTGAISAIKIGNDNFNETPGLGAKALEPEFAAQFIGKVPPLALTDIDAITGATVTSEAVINAINAAYEKLLAQQ